jgi:hypothetical protein
MKKLKKRVKVKQTLLFFFLSVVFILAGCSQPENARTPDERAGPNLIISFADKADTRRTAKAIADKTGGELFDVYGKKSLPNLLDYETFFVVFPSEEGRITPAPDDFLSRTDFLDGRVIPFWISREETVDLNEDFEKLLWGARFLSGGGLLFSGKVKAKDIEQMAGERTEAILTELGVRRAAGDRAEEMVKLFSEAYAERIGPAVFHDGDWTFEMDGVRWYYAQSRFLPEEDAARIEDFRPLFLYRYRLESPGNEEETNPWQDVANKIMFRRPSVSSSGFLPSNSGAARSPFYDALWQGRTKEEAADQQRRIKFLRWDVQVHRNIVLPLNRAEQRIQELAKTSVEIQEWMKNIQSITSWNWRNIAGSETRSFHAYGAAVDVLPKAQAGMETYWQWTAAKGIDWRTVPWEKRQNPPSSVIRTFEEQGFIWGGRWPRYDTMHFEYHPELLIMGTGRDSTPPPPPSQSVSCFAGNSS